MRDHYQVAVCSWEMQPSEFWKMSPTEWYWQFDVMREDRGNGAPMVDDELWDLIDG